MASKQVLIVDRKGGVTMSHSSFTPSLYSKLVKELRNIGVQVTIDPSSWCG